MGEKISTIVLKVDLECQRCYKKIRRVLCKIQDEMNIKTTSFDEKSNSVTISGPFDAEKVCRKLCCQAGRVIKEMNIKGKEPKDGGADKATSNPAEKGKKEKTKEAKPETDPAADAKPAKAIPKADIRPLLEKLMADKAGPKPPCGEPIAPPAVPAAAQGVAVSSIWPAPASSVAGYSYNPSYDPSYYGGGGGYGYGKPAAPGGYYGVPVYDNQGWYYGGRQPYYPQQQPCGEDPNAGCSVM